MINGSATQIFIINERVVLSQLWANPDRSIETVEAAYAAHGAGHTICPNSLFLKLKEPPNSRIIALPGSIVTETSQAVGLKWISSFPQNINKGTPRATAVIVLNNPDTGRPMAVLEGAQISAFRTAALAVSACRVGHIPNEIRLGIIGCGKLSETTLRLLKRFYFILKITAFDINNERTAEFLQYYAGDTASKIADDILEVFRNSDVVVIATTAAAPHIQDVPDLQLPRIIIHLSLRDLPPNFLSHCVNIVDDVDHAFRENTSLHLLQQLNGPREPIIISLFDLQLHRAKLPENRSLTYSPFGLGVLDIGLAKSVFQNALDSGEAIVVENFFGS